MLQTPPPHELHTETSRQHRWDVSEGEEASVWLFLSSASPAFESVATASPAVTSG